MEAANPRGVFLTAQSPGVRCRAQRYRHLEQPWQGRWKPDNLEALLPQRQWIPPDGSKGTHPTARHRAAKPSPVIHRSGRGRESRLSGSGNEKDLARVWAFHLSAGRKSTDVHIAGVRRVRAGYETGFAWNRGSIGHFTRRGCRRRSGCRRRRRGCRDSFSCWRSWHRIGIRRRCWCREFRVGGIIRRAVVAEPVAPV